MGFRFLSRLRCICGRLGWANRWSACMGVLNGCCCVDRRDFCGNEITMRSRAAFPRNRRVFLGILWTTLTAFVRPLEFKRSDFANFRKKHGQINCGKAVSIQLKLRFNHGESTLWYFFFPFNLKNLWNLTKFTLNPTKNETNIFHCLGSKSIWWSRRR